MKKILLIGLPVFIFLFILSNQVFSETLSVGTKEITAQNSLAEGKVKTYELQLQDDIKGISYYLRSQTPTICWLRLYDSTGKTVYSEDIGSLLGRFLGRTDTEIIENITDKKYTLDVLAPSYHSCNYTLYLKGLTQQTLISTAGTESYTINQELTKKTNEIDLLNKVITDLREEIALNSNEIKELTKQKEEMNNTLVSKENITQELQKKVSLLAKVSLALGLMLVILMGVGSYYLYSYTTKLKKRKIK